MGLREKSSCATAEKIPSLPLPERTGSRLMDVIPKLPELLDRLDELASLATLDLADGVVRDLVERAAALPGGLAELVRRYAEASNVTVPRAVSFVLAEQAGHRTDESVQLALVFAALARDVVDDSTLMNVLTALQRHLMFERLVIADRTTGSVLVEYLRHCLNQSPLVQDAAIDLVDQIEDDLLLPGVFNAAMFASLRGNVPAMSGAGDFRSERGAAS